VELHQLQCLVLVVEEGGFKRATARLHITQPALSYLIKQLEDELGVQLFHRRPRGVVPTDACRVLLQHAYRVINSVQAAHQAVRELSDGVTGEIRIGTINSVGTYFLPQVLWELRTRCPMVRPQLLYRNGDELIDSLVNNKLDVVLAADPRPDRRLRYQLVADDNISLVSSPGQVEPMELESAQFVSLSQQSPTGALIARHLDRLGVSVQPVVSTDNAETVKRMVEEGMGVAFLPDMLTSEEVNCGGKPGRLWRSAVEPQLTRHIIVATWRDSPRSRALEIFVDEVRRFGRRWRGCRPPEPARGS
jgi:DNA-binding transcriptional LysR family regulator